MNGFVLKNTFIKVYIHHYSINIYNNKRSKLYLGDRIVVLNVCFSRTGGVSFKYLFFLLVNNITLRTSAVF
jgi:hypothetical protein